MNNSRPLGPWGQLTPPPTFYTPNDDYSRAAPGPLISGSVSPPETLPSPKHQQRDIREDLDLGLRRQRNRKAAAKCRDRKKQQQMELELLHEKLAKLNADLKHEVDLLKNETLYLKNKLLNHTNECEDQAIVDYMSRDLEKNTNIAAAKISSRSSSSSLASTTHTIPPTPSAAAASSSFASSAAAATPTPSVLVAAPITTPCIPSASPFFEMTPASPIPTPQAAWSGTGPITTDATLDPNFYSCSMSSMWPPDLFSTECLPDEQADFGAWL